MNKILEELKQELQATADYGLWEREWAIVEKALERTPSFTNQILEWVFAELNGYVDTRVRAGRELCKFNRQRVWSVLELLIKSGDPDDRDTALTLLTELGSEYAYQLAKPILKDRYPYLQFDAVEFLKDKYPSEAIEMLQELAQHENPKTREIAVKYLHSMRQ